MTIKKTAKWMRKLTQRELAHLAETAPPVSGTSVRRPTLASLRRNLDWQAKSGFECMQCTTIARKLGIEASHA